MKALGPTVVLMLCLPITIAGCSGTGSKANVVLARMEPRAGLTLRWRGVVTNKGTETAYNVQVKTKTGGAWEKQTEEILDTTPANLSPGEEGTFLPAPAQPGYGTPMLAIPHAVRIEWTDAEGKRHGHGV